MKAEIINQPKKDSTAKAYFEKLESQAAFEHQAKKSFFADLNLDHIPFGL